MGNTVSVGNLENTVSGKIIDNATHADDNLAHGTNNTASAVDNVAPHDDLVGNNNSNEGTKNSDSGIPNKFTAPGTLTNRTPSGCETTGKSYDELVSNFQNLNGVEARNLVRKIIQKLEFSNSDIIDVLAFPEKEVPTGTDSVGSSIDNSPGNPLPPPTNGDESNNWRDPVSGSNSVSLKQVDLQPASTLVNNLNIRTPEGNSTLKLEPPGSSFLETDVSDIPGASNRLLVRNFRTSNPIFGEKTSTLDFKAKCDILVRFNLERVLNEAKTPTLEALLKFFGTEVAVLKPQSLSHLEEKINAGGLQHVSPHRRNAFMPAGTIEMKPLSSLDPDEVFRVLSKAIERRMDNSEAWQPLHCYVDRKLRSL
eukprot:TRINITY_DN383_c2_g1_i6.p1 TRINITY_DN383_c2_g1~~TRINITY_DN383_c2_g1_i6.p1  ORF type:complete len:395 (-),score=77.62 TRINITY_DN383_c2_g1_i6:574-1674(-)